MRISCIEIKDFRAFSGEPFTIDLTARGKNLLVYGENGSGKSSLYLALKNFLECATKKHDILASPFRNIFVNTDGGFIKLTLNDDTDKRASVQVYEWSHTKNETDKPLILEADKTKGFIDYKALLRTYFLHQEHDTVNIFDLLANGLLANVTNDITTRTFGEDWQRVKDAIPERNTAGLLERTERIVKGFNDGMRVKLDELQKEVGKVLGYFKYQISVEFTFGGVAYNRKSKKSEKAIINQEIGLRVKFFNEERTDHHHFLNEAKLSAIAISIFFAALLIQPTPPNAPRILALDDVLIGLDMSNRQPVLDILDDLFAAYQIFFITYDRAWYEIVKQRIESRKEAGKWRYVEFFAGNTDQHALPIYTADNKYLDRGIVYFNANDYRAAAVYLRTHFESIIKRFCNKERLKVAYQQDVKKMSSNDFWTAICTEKQSGKYAALSNATINDVEICRKITLNELSHESFSTIYNVDVERAIRVIGTLEKELNDSLKVVAAISPPTVSATPSTSS